MLRPELVRCGCCPRLLLLLLQASSSHALSAAAGVSALPAIALTLLLGGAVMLLVVVVCTRAPGHAAHSSSSSSSSSSAAAARDCKSPPPPPPPTDQHFALLQEQTSAWKKAGQHEEAKKRKRKEKAKESVNGHPPISNDIEQLVGEETKGLLIAEKKQIKTKKKKQRMDEGSSKQPNFSANVNVEEAGDWVTKISNREKRQMRKERQKKKSDTGSCLDPSLSCHSDGSKTASKAGGDNRGSDDQEESPGWSSPPVSVNDPAVSWNEPADKARGWQLTTGGGTDADRLGWGLSDRPVATSGWGGTVKETSSSSGVDWDTMESVEQDIFANIGTWDNKTGVKCPPVTFGAFPDSSCEAITSDNTSSQESPSRGQVSASLSSPTVDKAWLGLEDQFAVDLESDWNPPTEEWGNWTGQEILTVHELEKEKLKVSEEEEEKCQMNLSSSGKSKRKKKKKKGKQTDDATGQEELRDDPQKKNPSEEHSLGMVLEQSEIRNQQCLTEISLTETWNTGPSTASDKSNDFILNSTKTERKKMKARRET